MYTLKKLFCPYLLFHERINMKQPIVAVKPSLAYRTKKTVVNVALLALGVTFEKVSKHSAELKEEIKDWKKGIVISIGVLPKGPAISLKEENGIIRYLGKGEKKPDVKIYFKNVDSAFLPFTAQMGSHTAFVQHRALVHGSVVDGIKANRAMGIVQAYLLPGIVFKKVFKVPPKLSFKQKLFKLWVYLTMGFDMAVNAAK
jgi:hypothetical protein